MPSVQQAKYQYLFHRLRPRPHRLFLHRLERPPPSPSPLPPPVAPSAEPPPFKSLPPTILESFGWIFSLIAQAVAKRGLRWPRAKPRVKVQLMRLEQLSVVRFSLSVWSSISCFRRINHLLSSVINPFMILTNALKHKNNFNTSSVYNGF